MSFWSRFWNGFQPFRLEREFDEELQFHLDERVRSNCEKGMTVDAAINAAHKSFGAGEYFKSEMREIRMIDRRLTIGFVMGFVSGVTIAVVAAFLLRPTPAQTQQVLVVDPFYEQVVQRDITAPVPIERKKAEYTPAALNAKLAGVVKVGCIVQSSGVCTDVRVTRSLDPVGLDQEAVKAAKGWRFKPAMRSDKPVPYYVTIEIAFSCDGCEAATYKPITFTY